MPVKKNELKVWDNQPICQNYKKFQIQFADQVFKGVSILSVFVERGPCTHHCYQPICNHRTLNTSLWNASSTRLDGSSRPPLLESLLGQEESNNLSAGNSIVYTPMEIYEAETERNDCDVFCTQTSLKGAHYADNVEWNARSVLKNRKARQLRRDTFNRLLMIFGYQLKCPEEDETSLCLSSIVTFFGQFKFHSLASADGFKLFLSTFKLEWLYQYDDQLSNEENFQNFGLLMRSLVCFRFVSPDGQHRRVMLDLIMEGYSIPSGSLVQEKKSKAELIMKFHKNSDTKISSDDSDETIWSIWRKSQVFSDFNVRFVSPKKLEYDSDSEAGIKDASVQYRDDTISDMVIREYLISLIEYGRSLTIAGKNAINTCFRDLMHTYVGNLICSPLQSLTFENQWKRGKMQGGVLSALSANFAIAGKILDEVLDNRDEYLAFVETKNRKYDAFRSVTDNDNKNVMHPMFRPSTYHAHKYTKEYAVVAQIGRIAAVKPNNFKVINDYFDPQIQQESQHVFEYDDMEDEPNEYVNQDLAVATTAKFTLNNMLASWSKASEHVTAKLRNEVVCVKILRMARGKSVRELIVRKAIGMMDDHEPLDIEALVDQVELAKEDANPREILNAKNELNNELTKHFGKRNVPVQHHLHRCAESLVLLDMMETVARLGPNPLIPEDIFATSGARGESEEVQVTTLAYLVGERSKWST